MTRRNKIILAVFAWLLVLLILPFCLLKFASETSFMGVLILLFFLVNPFLAIALGIMAGTDLRHLWWIPIGTGIVFPLLMIPSVQELVWDLYVYSALYVGVSCLAMIGSCFCVKQSRQSKQKRRTDHE